MTRLAGSPGLVCATILLAALLSPSAVAAAAADKADTSFPVSDTDQLEMHTTVNCVLGDRQCYFTTQADLRTPEGITGFPNDLWARQTTTIRSSNQLNYLETQVVAANTRIYKAGAKREITTIYFGGGPVEKYQLSGQIQPTDWRTGQPMLDADVIVCAEIQVVYTGVNITSPSTCSQTRFS
jgi:hypothetical protein